jgi:hypothetical protein
MPEVRNELVIEAPVADVWARLIDAPAYADWNPHLLRIDGELKQGGVVTLHYKKEGVLPASFVVDVVTVDKERELRWNGPRNAAKAALRASHYFLLEADGERTRFTHGERFEGALAKRLWPFLRKKVEAGHRTVNDAIKRACET